MVKCGVVADLWDFCVGKCGVVLISGISVWVNVV